MRDFKPIYENNECQYLICKHCGERVERGIITVSEHYMNCIKNMRGLIITNNEFERQLLDELSIKLN